MRLQIPLLSGMGILAAMLGPQTGYASSHREAPFIAKNPAVDGTDFYMFNSYETGRAGFVTILANYLPLQDAYGGPNYFSLDPDALYEIHIDNTGDGVEDITFQFQFKSSLAANGNGLAVMAGGQSVAVPVVTLGPLADHDTELVSRNVIDEYSINVVRGPRRTGTVAHVTDAAGGATTFRKPMDNAGAKTFSAAGVGGYAAYADTFRYNIDVPGCTPPVGTHAQVFVGQRQEGFPVNLGQIFDLVNLNPIGTSPGVANLLGASDQGFNITADKNVTTIALEIPASCLTAAADKPSIGGWTTASMRQARVLNPTPTFTDPSRVGGPWVQVSRLGMPLVNEVVIGLKDKNKFNSSEPKDDAANFALYVTNPTLPQIIEILFGAGGAGFAPNRFPRTDLLTAFALGVPGVNAVGDGTTPAEMVRLNTTSAGPLAPRVAANQSIFGAATCFTVPDATTDATVVTDLTTCDPTGFPNGRRPGDDVVDIELRVAMGRLLNTTDAPKGQLPLVDGATFGTPGAANAQAIGGSMAVNFKSTFPYLNPPLGGAP